jgi:hypothetical protein
MRAVHGNPGAATLIRQETWNEAVRQEKEEKNSVPIGRLHKAALRAIRACPLAITTLPTSQVTFSMWRAAVRRCPEAIERAPFREEWAKIDRAPLVAADVVYHYHDVNKKVLPVPRALRTKAFYRRLVEICVEGDCLKDNMYLIPANARTLDIVLPIVRSRYRAHDLEYILREWTLRESDRCAIVAAAMMHCRWKEEKNDPAWIDSCVRRPAFWTAVRREATLRDQRVCPQGGDVSDG